jgi:hypothetical protein
VAVLDEGGYEIVRRATARNEYAATVATGNSTDLTVWLAARNRPERSTRQVSRF